MKGLAKRWVPAIDPYSVLGIVIPLACAAAYLHVDHRYQRNDEGYYLHHAREIYSAFRSGGVLRGIHDLFLTRFYKPILHPNLGAIAFLVAKGEPIQASNLAVLSFYAVFLVYITLFFRQFLSGFRLLLAVSILALAPVVVRSAATFNSELPFLMASAATLYYLVRCDFFRSLADTRALGVAFGVALCIRPVEALTTFSPIFAALLIFGVTVRGFLSFFLPAFLISFGWYGPFLRSLYAWVFQASFSDFTRITGHRDDRGKLAFISNVYAALGGWSLAWLAGIAVLNWKRVKNLEPRLRHFLPAVILLALVGPVAVGAFTYNADNRYYLMSLVIAYSTCLILALSPGAFSRARMGAVALLAFLLIAYRVSIIANVPVQYRLFALLGGPHIDEPLMNPDPIEALFSTFQSVFPLEQSGNGKFHICILQMRHLNDSDFLADPSVLSILADQKGLPWYFDRPWPFVRATTPERYEFVRKSCDYLVAMPIDGVPAKIEHFMSDVGGLVVARWKSGEIAADGLSLQATGKYRFVDGNEAGFVVFKNKGGP